MSYGAFLLFKVPHWKGNLQHLVLTSIIQHVFECVLLFFVWKQHKRCSWVDFREYFVRFGDSVHGVVLLWGEWNDKGNKGADDLMI